MNNEKPTVSVKNPYWISKHRYYELKHFCLQYEEWDLAYRNLKGLSLNPGSIIFVGCDDQQRKSKVERIALLRNSYSTRMDMVTKCCNEADPVIGPFIKIGVTEGKSYDTMKASLDIPCCREIYYDLYRKFFWLLSKERQ